MKTKKMLTVSLPAALTIALAAVAGSACAQQRNDLLSIYRDAVAFDPVFASARFTREAAQERTPQARGALLRTFRRVLASVKPTFTTAVRSFPLIQFVGPSLTATLPLYRPQLWNQLDQAKLTVRAGRGAVALARNDLVLRVTQAYFDVLAAQDALTAIEASKEGCGRTTGAGQAANSRSAPRPLSTRTRRRRVMTRSWRRSRWRAAI